MGLDADQVIDRISAQLVEGSDGLQRWEQTYDRTPGDEIKIQTVYAQAGLLDPAFDALEKGLAVKDPGLTGVRADPFLAPIRGDPRYRALVKSIKFPACT